MHKLMHCTNIFPASCRVLQALQGGTHDKILRRSVPTLHGCSVSSACLGAPFLAMMGIAYLAQGSVRGGEQEPRARASFAEKPCQLRTESGTRFETWRSRDDIVVFWEVIRTCSYFPLHGGCASCREGNLT